jgi:hypothetical protein
LPVRVELTKTVETPVPKFLPVTVVRTFFACCTAQAPVERQAVSPAQLEQ